MHSEAYRKSIAVKSRSHNPHPALSACSLTLHCSLPSVLFLMFFPSLHVFSCHTFLLTALTLSCTFSSMYFFFFLPPFCPLPVTNTWYFHWLFTYFFFFWKTTKGSSDHFLNNEVLFWIVYMLSCCALMFEVEPHMVYLFLYFLQATTVNIKRHNLPLTNTLQSSK